MRTRWLAALCLLPALAVAAAEEALQATAGSRLLAPEAVFPGQRVTWEVEILSNALSFQGLRVVPPAVRGGLLVSDAASSVKGTRRVDGESRQYVTYRFPVYPQRPGTLAIAAATVSFTGSLGYGRPGRDFRLETEALTLPVRALPEGLPLAAAGLTASARLEPPGVEVAVGDARTLVITRRLEDAPALLLEPLALPALPGVSLYPETAELRTESARGRLTGVRRDRFTLVFETPGTASLPALRFPWWDPVAGEARAATVPALRFEITSAAGRGGDKGEGGTPTTLAIGAALIATLIASGYALRRRSAGNERRQHFSALKRAARRNDARAAHAAFLRWQGCAGTVSQAPVLAAPLRELEEALVAGTPWNGRRLRGALRECRRSEAAPGVALPALNPGSRRNSVAAAR